jgi:hypothetical protein
MTIIDSYEISAADRARSGSTEDEMRRDRSCFILALSRNDY